MTLDFPKELEETEAAAARRVAKNIFYLTRVVRT